MSMWNFYKRPLILGLVLPFLILGFLTILGFIQGFLDLTILDEKEREKVMKFITDATNKIASLKAGAKGAGEEEDKTPI